MKKRPREMKKKAQKSAQKEAEKSGKSGQRRDAKQGSVATLPFLVAQAACAAASRRLARQRRDATPIPGL
ncbi:hypothetical protein NP118_23190 [Salmonella enterica]|nr:hypothetical protein [Salmonella enterica]